MPLSRSGLNIATAAAFTTAVVAGWFSVREPEDSPGAASRIAELFRGGASAPVAKTSTAVPPPAAGADAARFERDLAGLLDPAAASGGAFSGERMEELFAEYDATAVTAIDFLIATPSTPGHVYARRWAEHAPQEMFRWFLRRRSFHIPKEAGSNRFFPGTILFEVWAAKDPGAALRAAVQWPVADDRAHIIGTVIQRLRETDPARAAAAAAEHLALFAGRGRLASQWLAGGFTTDDWKFLCALPAGKMRASLLADFLTFAPSTPDRVMLQAWNETAEEIRREVIAAGYAGFQDLRAAGEEAIPAIESLSDARRAVIEQTGDKDLTKEHLQMTVWPWAREDFPAAMAWTQQHLKGRQRVEGTALLFGAAAGQDFDAALAAWEALPPGYLRARAVGSLAVGAPAERRAEVNTLLESLSPTDRKVAEDAGGEAWTVRGFHVRFVNH